MAGTKVDIEGFEIDVLAAALALAECGIGLIQLEWNKTPELALGTDRRPVADLSLSTLTCCIVRT